MKRSSIAGVALPVVVGALLAHAGCADDDTATAGAGGAGAGATTSAAETVTSASGSSATGLPESFRVVGQVVDQAGLAVADAIVMQGGGEQQTLSAADGTFSVVLTNEVVGERVVVAAKQGYRSDGIPFETVPAEPVTLVLHEIKQPDNALGYQFGHPGVGDPVVDNNTTFCGHCHTTFAREFNESAHARSAKNPKVQDVYAGVATALAAGDCAALGGTLKAGQTPGSPGQSTARCYVGNGVLADLNTCGQGPTQSCDDPALPAASAPTAFGSCADCHGFGMDGTSGGRDLLEAEGIGYEFGVHCDACHHIRDVDLSLPPGGAGRLMMQRPREKLGDEISGPIRQAMFGPYPDVPTPFMGGSYQPKFSTADLCAGCHDQKQPALLPGATLDAKFPDGLPTHATYSEWQEGAWGGGETPCQHCHMPPRFGLTNAVDVTTPADVGISFGFAREPESIRSHSFRGPLTKIDGFVPRLLDGAVSVQLTASPIAGQLEVSVSLTNIGCGHAVPTGEPMRSLILVVRADGCGQSFQAVGGQTIDDVGTARLAGVVGADAQLSAGGIVWAAAAQASPIGRRIRVSRSSGAFLDYDGVGLFALGTLPASQKGTPLVVPVSEATVISLNGTELLLDQPLVALAGDSVQLGDPLPNDFLDGAASTFLAGQSGATFSKVLTDPDGTRRVPHYRAIDIASDNRIRPFVEATSAHTFAIPTGCTSADVRATLLYRPHPVDQALLRGWDARDYRAGEAVSSLALP